MPPVTQVSIFSSPLGATDPNILGGERDLQFSAQSGAQGRVFSSSVSDGQWETASPNRASGVVLMQYDATDNSITLDPAGFLKITGTSRGIDFTEGGLGESFHSVIEADLPTSYTLKVYSPNSNVCQFTESVPGDNVPLDSVVNFSEFTGNCDFENVGAVEIVLQALENVDAIFTLFATQGEPNPVTPSNTPSPTRGASPSPSPSPVVAECYCQCPAFTCELIFDLDDDDNHALFFVDDDGFALSRGYFGGYGYYYANRDGKSGATTLVASVAAIFVALLGFF